MDNLKQEIDLRYNIVQFKKSKRNYIYNRYEKNNVQLIYNTIEEIKMYRDMNAVK